MELLAMHIPDGFFGIPASLAAAAVSLLALVYAARRSRRDLDDRVAPLAGLTAVFIFAGQMLNFPVGAGTSGHLLGAALAAILVGPWVAVLVMTVVLVVQALVFADGGLTALGLNVLNMAVVAVLVAWVVFRVAARVLPDSRVGVAVAAGLAGWASVVASAVAFSLEYAVGGAAPISPTMLLAAMTGVHAVIGVVEGVVTGLVVAAVVSARPDIVAGLRPTRTEPAAEAVGVAG